MSNEGQIFDLKKFKSVLSNLSEVSSDEKLMRKILNIITSNNIKAEDYLFLLENDNNVLENVLSELNKPLSDMNILKDMILGEYLKDNVNSTPIWDEEEIY